VPWDPALAQRLRDELVGTPGLTEQKMFGGLAFLIGGNMAAAASSDGGLLLRCAPEQTEVLCEQPHASAMVMRGREMVGWLRVRPAGFRSDEDLARWVSIGRDYAASLPAKEAKGSARTVRGAAAP
jgi:hypothetical protein